MPLPRVFKLLLALTLFSAAPFTAYAETLWLSDVLWVNVRTGPGSEYRSLKTITSGTRMEVLEELEDSDFIRVRTEDGLEGWIPKRYTFDEPTGRIQAENMAAEKQQLQQQYDTLEAKYTALLADKGDVNGELETLRTNNAELSKELNRIKAISGDAINLDAEYQDLAEENARVKNELDVLKAENSSLKEYNDTQMLYVGGILIIIGIILGVVLPRLTGRKRKDGWQ
ncbi:TIGR04211 family SH3 domain-containing protein [Reinekea sp. G2M2-21]|jgi:SH3 domain protein|uniref:TIGR04211 family SH3 domain-containing protein n=1 Tax=Reinekea sp. G2M2-21 TaxID=2788942 RepID=UPI0018AAA4EB|nr:TIGR04211 family SH3 domain-containing protein [Reinekea sp. G2M2-21]MDX1343551.1 TIGR04211 family SH3 domain-containing protein [Reinekea sp.]